MAPLALVRAWPHGGGSGLLLNFAALFPIVSGSLALIACPTEAATFFGIEMRQAQALERSEMRIARGSMLLAAMLVGMVVSSASPVLAQTQEQPRSSAATAQNAPDITDYELQDDGTVIIGGDTATDCRSFALYLDNPNYEPPGSWQQARDVLQQCKERETAGQDPLIQSCPTLVGRWCFPLPVCSSQARSS